MRSLPSGLGHAKLTRRGGVTGVKDKGGRIRISEPGFVHHFYPGPPRLFRIWPLTMQLSITAGNKCGDKDHTGFGDAYSRNTDTELQTLGGARWIDRASGHTSHHRLDEVYHLRDLNRLRCDRRHLASHDAAIHEAETPSNLELQPSLVVIAESCTARSYIMPERKEPGPSPRTAILQATLSTIIRTAV
jgi:hypothetical protein